jgi:hypothetical protein
MITLKILPRVWCVSLTPYMEQLKTEKIQLRNAIERTPRDQVRELLLEYEQTCKALGRAYSQKGFEFLKTLEFGEAAIARRNAAHN